MSTRERVAALLDEGLSGGEIARRLGMLGGPRHRGHLKGRLLRMGLKDGRCEICGICDWRGAPLSLALHHVNGDGDDNRLENLQVLCPNCHSQTENFAGRNARKGQIPPPWCFPPPDAALLSGVVEAPR